MNKGQTSVLSKLLVSQTGKQDRRTPFELFEELDKEFKFKLDPCTSNSKNGNLKTPFCFNKQQNGLIQEWNYDSIFINPPFRDVPKWIQKVFSELEKPFNKTIVMLLPSKTETRWWHNLITSKYLKEIRFQKGRVTFEGHKNPFIIGITYFILTNKGDEKT